MLPTAEHFSRRLKSVGRKATLELNGTLELDIHVFETFVYCCGILMFITLLINVGYALGLAL